METVFPFEHPFCEKALSIVPKNDFHCYVYRFVKTIIGETKNKIFNNFGILTKKRLNCSLFEDFECLDQKNGSIDKIIVNLKMVCEAKKGILLTEKQINSLLFFHFYIFTRIYKMKKSKIKKNYIIVPLNKEKKDSLIDWKLIKKLKDHEKDVETNKFSLNTKELKIGQMIELQYTKNRDIYYIEKAVDTKITDTNSITKNAGKSTYLEYYKFRFNIESDKDINFGQQFFAIRKTKMYLSILHKNKERKRKNNEVIFVIGQQFCKLLPFFIQEINQLTKMFQLLVDFENNVATYSFIEQFPLLFRNHQFQLQELSKKGIEKTIFHLFKSIFCYTDLKKDKYIEYLGEKVFKSIQVADTFFTSQKAPIEFETTKITRKEASRQLIQKNIQNYCFHPMSAKGERSYLRDFLKIPGCVSVFSEEKYKKISLTSLMLTNILKRLLGVFFILNRLYFPKDPSKNFTYLNEFKEITHHQEENGGNTVCWFLNWLNFEEIKDRKYEAMKLLSQKDTDEHLKLYSAKKLNTLESLLHYSFRRKILLIEAITHSSYINKSNWSDYENLEFYGDGILDLFFINFLIEKKEEDPQSQCNLYVQNDPFGKFILAKGIDKFLLNEEELQFQSTKIGGVSKCYGDLFESITAAIFIDSGFQIDAIKPWIMEYYNFVSEKIKKNFISNSDRKKKKKDNNKENLELNKYGSLFSEYCQKEKIKFSFGYEKEETDGEQIIWKCSLAIEGKMLIISKKGKSKKIAKFLSCKEFMQNNKNL